MPLFLIKFALKRALRKKNKHKRRLRIILTSIIAVLVVVTVVFVSTASTMFLLAADSAITVMSYDTNDNKYSVPDGDNLGQYIKLSGGLTAMGVNFEQIISDLQASYDSTPESDAAARQQIQGNIQFVQLIQILDAESVATGYPMLLLGMGIGIRETSCFVNNASYASKSAGPRPRDGIYGTWYNRNVNGLLYTDAYKNFGLGGGIIAHTGASPVSDFSSHVNESMKISFTDMASNTTSDIVVTDRKGNTLTYNHMLYSDTANAYNKGAYGPMQIEADHWVTFVEPASSSDWGKGYYNIPLSDASFDNKRSGFGYEIPNTARSVVTANNSHLAILRPEKNKAFVDTIMNTVGHPNYLTEYADMVKGEAEFSAGNYYFSNRFSSASTMWEDWILSLEAFPHTYTLLPLYMISNNYIKKLNDGCEIVNAAGKELILSDVLERKYGENFMHSFENDTALDIFWTLSCLQTWNWGNAPWKYSTDKNSCKIAYFYRDLANYIAKFGTKELRGGTDADGNIIDAYIPATNDDRNNPQKYLALYDFIAGKLGIQNTEEYRIGYTAMQGAMSPTSKSCFGYAVTGLFDAEAMSEAIAHQLLGLTEFNIYNYGGKQGYEEGEITTPISADEIPSEFADNQTIIDAYKQGGLVWPAESSSKITSKFGNRMHPIYKRMQLHNGIDIGAPGESNIRAAMDGTVSYAAIDPTTAQKPDKGAGYIVRINHGNGIVSFYYHCYADSFKVSVGQQVKAGDVIALVGTTGGSTGNHLHFGLMKDGQVFNPELLYYREKP